MHGCYHRNTQAMSDRTEARLHLKGKLLNADGRLGNPTLPVCHLEPRIDPPQQTLESPAPLSHSLKRVEKRERTGRPHDLPRDPHEDGVRREHWSHRAQAVGAYTLQDSSRAEKTGSRILPFWENGAARFSREGQGFEWLKKLQEGFTVFGITTIKKEWA